MEVDDLALLERWRAGDRAAGQALFARHFATVFRFFETKCEPEAEELTQSTFLACVRARDQFRQDSSFRTYLFTIARHELCHHLRTKSRKQDKLDFAVSSIADLVSTAGTRLGRAQEHRQLVDALHRLPVDQQVLLELHYWEEVDIAGLVEIFETTAVAIRSRLHRARKSLRAQLVAVAPPEALQNDETLDRWMQDQQTVVRGRHIPGEPGSM
ncbi:MAG: sigma-70 family RNA polymerase sigma factor [Kofleriaceae bacterium]